MTLRRRKLTIVGVVVATVVFVVTAGVVAIHHGFSARDKPSAMENLIATTARSLAVPSKARNLPNPVRYSDTVLEEARAHWAEHCSFCHANDGSGNTEAGRSLYPKAPDMRASGTQSLTDGELYYTIKNGVRLTGMPAWGEAGDSDMDSWKLVYFIRHLPKMTTQEAEEMKKLKPEERLEFLKKKAEERKAIQKEIGDLGAKRQKHLDDEAKKQPKSAGEQTLDDALKAIIRDQAAAKGFEVSGKK